MNMRQNGSYSDMSIMEMYSIMKCYSSCCEELNEEHTNYNNCICSICFTNKHKPSKHSNDEKKIKESICNHYNTLVRVEKIYQNFNYCITENLHINERITYNINHSVSFGRENNNFNLYEKFPIIGHSDNDVIFAIIKPSFNKLNFNSTMTQLIFSTYVLLNQPQNGNNAERYNNKNIHCCIITLDSEQPIFYTINIDKNNLMLNGIIRRSLYDCYKKHHSLVYEFYEYCRKNKPIHKSSIRWAIELLEFLGDNSPIYIRDFFKEIENKITKDYNYDKQKKNEYIACVNDKRWFIEKINDDLKLSIDRFLKSDTNVEDDCDF
jgi:hypothetical protein